MNLNEYQSLARRTQNAKLNPHERKEHALMGMIGEFVDLLWFIAEFCDVLRVDLDHVCERNIDKLRGRYPEGFAEARSIHRAPETECAGGRLKIKCYGDRDECDYFCDGNCGLYDRPCADIHVDLIKGDGEE